MWFLLTVVGWAIVLFGAISIFRLGHECGRESERAFNAAWSHRSVKDGQVVVNADLLTCYKCKCHFRPHCDACNCSYGAQAVAPEPFIKQEILTDADDSL